MSASSWFRTAGLFAAGTLAVAAATLSGSASGSVSGSVSAGGGTAGAPGAPAAVVHAGERTSTVRVGPFVLPTDGAQVPVLNQFIPNVPKPCEDCFITAIEPRLVTADGARADMSTGVMLHHVLIAEPGQDDVTCPRNDGLGAMGRRIFAAGDERTTVELPHRFGYRVDSGPWVGLIELMNYGSEQQVVYFEAVVHHLPASTRGMLPVTPVWLDVDNCRTSMYAVPKGKSATEWSWISTLTGRIVAASGHVHAGGVGLTLDNATTKQRICSSRAGYGSGAHEGMVTSMSTCSWDSLGPLRAGDKLTMTSLYDAPKAMDDVMGIMLIAVYETDAVNGGRPAPAEMRDAPTTAVPESAAHDHGGGGH